jgi:FlaG/FlaF family flagellin (archaellin)
VKKIAKSRRAVSNIVATMLIFALMVIAMGILYSTISPTILGFDAKARSANQEFIFLTIGDEVNSLASSPVGSQGRVPITSVGGYYDIGPGHSLYVNITAANVLIDPDANYTQAIGEFTAQVNGSFQYEGGTKYLSRLNSEDVLLHDDTRELNTNYVAKADYRYGSALFTLYPMAWLDIVSTGTSYTVTITIIQLDYITFNPGGGEPVTVDFPIEKDEWTLRLRKLSPKIITNTTIPVSGPYKISHSIDGNSSITPQYSFGSDGTNITFRIVIIPILFSI